MRALIVGFVVACAIAPAAASTIVELSPVELYEGAERVVGGTVIDVHVQWDARHTGLETVATIAIDTTLRGPATPTVQLVVPGGALDGVRHIVFGAPSVTLGEHALWFLRDRGDGRLGVYGWSQGKRGGIAAQFATNGMVWPSSPVPYVVNRRGSRDLSRTEIVAAIDAAFATWQRVPCSTLAFENTGFTNLELATDNTNVVMFLETGWVYGAEAAAVTSLYIVPGKQTADIALNGQNFRWAIEPSNALMATTLDLQAVLTHEVGHFAGLGHTMRAYDTMYYTWKPWQGQRTLSIDDKLGLCSIYPTTGNECPCPAGETCTQFSEGTLCAGTPDPIGTPCNYDRVECDGFCLFTSLDLSTGYCSKFCTDDHDCPLTHHCAPASEGSNTVMVCMTGAQMQMPDPPEPMTCAADDACPLGQFCDVSHGACTFECRSDADCAVGKCNERGACEGGFVVGGGGCASADGSAAGRGGGIALCFLLLFVRRRR